MTSTMPDHPLAQPVTANLRAGSLVYLWAPDERPGADRPRLARVERASVDNIVGVDLADNGRVIYPVGSDIAPSLRWTWELAAPPQLPPAFADVEIVAPPEDISDRTRLLAGEPGAQLKVTLINGEVTHGVLTRLFMGQCTWEAEWGELVDAVPGGDVHIHAVRIEHVSKISRTQRV